MTPSSHDDDQLLKLDLAFSLGFPNADAFTQAVTAEQWDEWKTYWTSRRDDAA